MRKRRKVNIFLRIDPCVRQEALRGILFALVKKSCRRLTHIFIHDGWHFCFPSGAQFFGRIGVFLYTKFQVFEHLAMVVNAVSGCQPCIHRLWHKPEFSCADQRIMI